MALMVKGLHYAWGMNDEKLFALIDQLGGWPVGYKYVGFEHTDEREAGFSNNPNNTGWWTTIFEADDYYLWKLSPKAIERIVEDIHEASWVSRPATEKIKFRNSKGYVAVMQKAEEKK